MAACTERDCFYCVYVRFALEAVRLGKPSLGLGFRLRRTHSVSWVVSSAHKSNTLKAGCYFCLRVGLALEVKSLPHLQ